MRYICAHKNSGVRECPPPILYRFILIFAPLPSLSIFPCLGSINLDLRHNIWVFHWNCAIASTTTVPLLPYSLSPLTFNLYRERRSRALHVSCPVWSATSNTQPLTLTPALFLLFIFVLRSYMHCVHLTTRTASIDLPLGQAFLFVV